MKVFFRKNNKNYSQQLGFTLVEIIVSLGLFTVVSLISVGALLSIVDANKKAQSLKSVMNNLNFALESMSKEIRVGSTYYCDDVVGSGVPGGITSPQNCSSGGNFFAYEASDGDGGTLSDQVIYRLNGTQIERSTDGGSTFVGLTAPEVRMDEDQGLRFYVTGALPGDNLQPKVTIVLQGEAGPKEKTITEFNIQTTVSQRFRDD